MYSAVVQEHFHHPRRVGPREGATHQGTAGVPGDGPYGDGPYVVLWFALTMGYDAVGNRTTLVDPSGGIFTYSYDALNYDAASQRTTLLEGNGMKRQYQYDAAGRLTTQIELNASNNPVVTILDTYDSVGNRT